MEIPITISIKGNSRLYADLFGLGEEVKDPEILKYLSPSNETPRYVNKSVIISEGITLSEPKGKQYTASTESLETGFIDYNFILAITNSALGLGVNVYQLASWFLDKIQHQHYKIKIGDKEVKTKNEFQKTLDEYIKNNST